MLEFFTVPKDGFSNNYAYAMKEICEILEHS